MDFLGGRKACAGLAFTRAFVVSGFLVVESLLVYQGRVGFVGSFNNGRGFVAPLRQGREGFVGFDCIGFLIPRPLAVSGNPTAEPYRMGEADVVVL